MCSLLVSLELLLGFAWIPVQGWCLLLFCILDISWFILHLVLNHHKQTEYNVMYTGLVSTVVVATAQVCLKHKRMS